MTHLQVISTLGAAALLLIVLELVRRRRLLERYALVWLAVGVALVVLGAWGGLLKTISDTLGVAAPANALFAIGLGFLIVLVLNFSVAVSQLTDQSKVLAQRLALLEERLRRQERLADGAAAAPEPEPEREPLSS